jgi:hypothetical protein
MTESRNRTRYACGKSKHMEIFMHDGREDNQPDSCDYSDERERNDRKPDELERARKDEQPRADSEDACAVPADGAAEERWPPRKQDMANDLVTDANECD